MCRILGYEGVSVIDAVGPTSPCSSRATAVLISCITACSTYDYCRRGIYSYCRTGGWILGNVIDGGGICPHPPRRHQPIPHLRGRG
ncbi:hypothetical protein GGTG_14226 [Gaeumannomyces tritici R3-111a-1]|uniref:Uncharacterized protein n=1 Tax=Gaeumannomyces tritici (strain R3-111a-1) TaxID=644352 RepID=J3PKZ7_GAET3|nr:hypothetical protein GGTG_14226 [Gaeumannomyces tritici R3-111a-1]EJT68193.1 hypothetical protein GGTG_14226 [Gaeumannomyces tritici R3-111a-1]